MRTDRYALRARNLAVVLLAGLALVALNLFRMQILEGDRYRSLSEKNRVRVIYLEAPRGNVTDRNGKLVATSRLSYSLSAMPREAYGAISQSCALAAPLLGEAPEALERRFRRGKPGAFNSILLAEDIPAAAAVALEERLDQMPGFMIETRPQRVYPLGPAAAHLIGYLGPMTDEERDSLVEYGYRRADWLGREGVEQSCESYLRGTSGGLQIEVDSRGKLVRALGVREPAEGKDIALTVDADLQKHVHGLLDGQKGSVLVMRLDDGAILSLNSAPSYDPNLFASAGGRKDVGPYLADPDAPMMNRGTRGRYPPGSIFKIVTALAALEKKRIDAGTEVFCPGYTMIGGLKFRCWKEAGHGGQTLTEAFAHSCNAYFQAAGIRAGFEAVRQMTLAFGFGEPTGIDLPGERSGFVPSRDWKKKKLKQGWYDGDTANLSIGQGYLQTSPLQTLVMTGAVATGEVLRPRVLETVNGVKVGERHARSLGVSSRALAAVRRGLKEVVQSDTGTGRLARVPGLAVAGKTGTAQSGQDKNHAWFVGYAPDERPKVAVAVFLEHGGRGGLNAARVAQGVLLWLHERGYA